MKKTIRTCIIIAVLCFGFVRCDIDSPSPPPNIQRFLADTYTGSDKIKYSFTYSGYDFYYIYLGRLQNIPIFNFAAQYHDGIVESIYSVSITETIINTVSQVVSTSSQTAIITASEHTTSITTGGSVSSEINAKFPLKLVNAGVKTSAENNWSNYISNTTSTTIQHTTSLTNTIEHASSHARTTMEERTFNLNKDLEAGFYRYTLFSDSDVYLYVIKDSATGEIDYEFREHVIPDLYFWQLDYSETSIFSKNNITSFRLDTSILENLPDTLINLTTKREAEIRREFTSAGNHSFNFNEGFPAIIEVYVLGAGGGGQGGHHAYNLFDTVRGTGGSGGGGSAAYMKISVEEPVTVNVTVGSGGTGGRARSVTFADWQSGNRGNDGGNTSVRIGSTTLTAEGGKGGGGGNQTITGGVGGMAGPEPAGLLDWTAASGGAGNNGVARGDRRTTNRGGNAGSINIGSETAFGGGLGAINNAAAHAGGGGRGGYNDSGNGIVGGNGHVLVIISYIEEL